MTSASSFQMLRGAVIIFTGLLSVAFLGRRLAPNQWIGIFITILGLVIVGLADFISGNKDSSHKLSDVITGKMFCFLWGLFLNSWQGSDLFICLFDMIGSQSVSVKKKKPHSFAFVFVFCLTAGDLLIIMAQIIVSVQMVLEEKFVYTHDVHPLRAVGTEGTTFIRSFVQLTTSDLYCWRLTFLERMCIPSNQKPTKTITFLNSQYLLNVNNEMGKGHIPHTNI